MWRITGGLFLGWSLGANHSANIFGTAVASGLVRFSQAVWLTAAYVVLGAAAEGTKCMATYSKLAALHADAAFALTVATAVTMTGLTRAGVPASTSQALVGAIIGWSLLDTTADFSQLFKIVVCWVLTPVAAVVSSTVLHRGLERLVVKRIRSFSARNRFFLVGVLLTGCYAAYGLGANSVANVTGVYVNAGLLREDMGALLGGLSIAAGILTYSRRVMLTVGKGIVPLDPFSAMVVVFAEAATLHLFTQLRVPVSSSQAVVGAVLGVGVAKDLKTINARTVLKIAFGWVLTPVGAGALALGAHALMNALGL
uniref:Inorganic phosphate transporter n=1 Tax=Desulfacinum infernum TaxID=35837 RepID=A0A831ZZX4_9BACT